MRSASRASAGQSCEMRLTERIRRNHFLPVTDEYHAAVSDLKRGEKGTLTSRQKMGPFERQRSQLWRPDPHRITIHDGDHEEHIKIKVECVPSSAGPRTSHSGR